MLLILFLCMKTGLTYSKANTIYLQYTMTIISLVTSLKKYNRFNLGSSLVTAAFRVSLNDITLFD